MSSFLGRQTDSNTVRGLLLENKRIKNMNDALMNRVRYLEDLLRERNGEEEDSEACEETPESCNQVSDGLCLECGGEERQK
jgi:hypothetical protein